MLQIEKLRLAAEMLPPDDGHQKAARLVEQATQVSFPLYPLLLACLQMAPVMLSCLYCLLPFLATCFFFLFN
jgi:hypothetical protein